MGKKEINSSCLGVVRGCSKVGVAVMVDVCNYDNYDTGSGGLYVSKFNQAAHFMRYVQIQYMPIYSSIKFWLHIKI